jgi:hypothetical protein
VLDEREWRLVRPLIVARLSVASWQAWRLLLSGSQEIEQGHSSKIGIRLA